MIKRFALLAAVTLVLTAAAVRPGLCDAESAAAPKAGKGAYYFDQAIQNYLKGDSGAAIQQLNESLKADPGNQRAKVFLLKLLVERGSRLFLAKQYQKAYDYLSQAYAMDPNNEQVRQMFDIAAKQVKPQQPVTKVMLIPQGMQTEMLKSEAAAHAQAMGAPAAALAAPSGTAAAPAGQAGKVMPMYAEPAPMEAGAGAPQPAAGSVGLAEEYAKNVSAMMSLLNSFQRRQERQIEQFTVPLERIQNLYYQSEQDRKNFLNQMDARFKSVLGNVSFQQRMMIYGFIFGLLLLGVVVWCFYLIVGRMRSKREEMIMKYQQEMLKMVRDMAALPGSGSYGAYLPTAAGNYRLAANPVQQIAAPPGEGAPTLSVDLEQMTQTGNFKERALAAVKMLDLNAERAADILKDMAGSADPFQRENTFFALGEQYHPLTLDLLLTGTRDAEERAVAAAVRSLRRLEKNAPGLPEEARERIRETLDAWEDGAADRKKRS